MDSDIIPNLVIDLVRKQLSQKTTLQIRSSGWSMFPTIFPGRIINVEKKAFSEITLGDIILFEVAQNIIIHRVIRKKTLINQQICYWTKGDARWRFDPPVIESAYLGHVVSNKHKWHAFNKCMKHLQLKFDQFRIQCHLIRKKLFLKHLS